MRHPSQWLMFAATTLGAAGIVLVVTTLAAHIYTELHDQRLAALIPVAHWLSAIPFVFICARISRFAQPARLVALLYGVLAACSAILIVAGGTLESLILVISVRGGADFLVKNSRAQWLKGAMMQTDRPEKLGSFMSTSQYVGSLLGGGLAVALIGHQPVEAALMTDVGLCLSAAVLASLAGEVTKEPERTTAASAMGWVPMFQSLREKGLLPFYALLVGLGGLFQGFHQVAKVGLTGSLEPIAASSVPGLVQTASAVGILGGALCAARRGFYGSAGPLAFFLALSLACILAIPALIPGRPVVVLGIYAAMMLFFELCFCITNNRLLIEVPFQHVRALHATNYVFGYLAMSTTAFAAGWLFDWFGVRAGTVTLVGASVVLFGSIMLALLLARVPCGPTWRKVDSETG